MMFNETFKRLDVLLRAKGLALCHLVASLHFAEGMEGVPYASPVWSPGGGCKFDFEASTFGPIQCE